MEDETEIFPVASVTEHGGPAVHDRGVRPPLGDEIRRRGDLDQPGDRTDGHPVVHGNEHGPVGVPIHDPLQADLLSDHRAYTSGPGIPAGGSPT